MIAASGLIQRTPTLEQLREHAARLEQERQIPAGLFSTLVQAESSWNPKAVSPTGARGLAQIIPSTGRQPGFGVQPIGNIDDPTENLRFGSDYLGAMLKRYDGDKEAALLAYNQGPGYADKWIKANRNFAALPEKVRAEGQPYVAKILRGIADAVVPIAQAADEPDAEYTDFANELDAVGDDEGFAELDAVAESEHRSSAAQAGPDSALTRGTRAAAQTLIAGPAQLMSRPLAALGKVLPDDINVSLPVVGDINVAEHLKRAPEAADQFAANLRADRKAGAPEGIDWASLGGDVAATLPAGGLKVAQGLGKGAQFANQAIQGGVAGSALTPSTEQSVGTNAGIGAAANVLLPPVFKAIGGKLRPAAEQLKKAGVRLTPGQRAGGTIQRVEQAARSVPLVGDFIKNRERDAFSDFNRAVANAVLEPVGKAVPKNIEPGHETVKHVSTILGARYDKILTYAVAKEDQQFRTELTALAHQAQQLPQEKIGQLQRILKAQLLDKLGQGPVTGRQLKSIDSELGRLTTRYVTSGDADQRFLGDLLGDLHLSFKELVERSSPPAVGKELKKTNAAWARFLRMQTAASRVTSEDGIFTPEAFTGAVRALDKSRHKGAYAKGEALMQEIAEAGRKVLGNKVPDSGTASRIFTSAGIGGLIDPSIALTLGAGALPYTRGGMAVTNQLLRGAALGSPLSPQLGVMGANQLLDPRQQ